MDTWSSTGYTRWRRARKGWLLRLALAALVTAVGVGSRLHAHELMLKASLEDMVAEAEWAVAADLVAQQPRRHSRGNLIVTDDRFPAFDVLLDSPDSGFSVSAAASAK